MVTRFAWLVAAVALAPLAVAADPDPDRGAFCELTPCIAGPVKRRVLARDERVNRVTCKKGTELGVDAARNPVFCTTARASDVDGLPVAAGAYTLFHPSGRIYQTHLRRTTVIELADRSSVTCGADLIAIADDGTLRYCKLAGKRGGNPRARIGEGISFHPDGRLASLVLDEPATIAKLALPAGTHVVWDAGGAPIGGYTSAPVHAGALSIEGDFTLHPSGALHAVALAAAATVDGHAFPERARLEFRGDGTLARADYVAARGFMIHGEQWTDTVHESFDATGKLVTASTTEHWQSTARPPRYRP